MLRRLLEERFGLKTHPETKTTGGYALMVGKDGAKLSPAVEPSGAPLDKEEMQKRSQELMRKRMDEMIAIIRGQYFVIHGNQLIVFDTTTWGWITMIWGIVLFLAGLALWGGSGWARWLTIVLVSLNTLAQLSWLGNTQYPLWSLTIIFLSIFVIYALTARWGGYPEEARAT